MSKKIMLGSIDKALEGYSEPADSNTPTADTETQPQGGVSPTEGEVSTQDSGIETKPNKTGQPEEASAPKKTEQRDESGRFKPKADAAPVDPSLTQKAPATEDATKATIQAPASWTQNAKADFASLPQNVQSEISRMEAERVKAVRTAQDERANLMKRYGDIEPTLQLHRQRLAMRGETESQAVRRLFDLEAVFDRDPVSVIKELARQRGINLATLSQDADVSNDLDDPVIGRLSQLESQIKSREQMEAEQARSQNAMAFEAFEKEADEAGNPKYPHVNALMEKEVWSPFARANIPVLAHHIHQIRASNPMMPAQQVLRAAYENAIYSDPDIRNTILQAEREKATRELASQQRAKAEKAQKAAVSVKGSNATPIVDGANGQPNSKSIVGRHLDRVMNV